jgi:hypothetical protein
VIGGRLALYLAVSLAGVVACPADDEARDPEGVPAIGGLRPAMSEEERRRRRAELPKLEAVRRAQAETLLGASDPQLRAKGVALMRSDHVDEGAILVAMLAADPSPAVRARAAAQLDLAEPEDALEPLLDALDDSEPEVVIAALRTIEMLGDAAVIPRLRPYQRHSERIVRVAVASAIDVLE